MQDELDVKEELRLEMKKEQIEMNEGNRYLIYYTFEKPVKEKSEEKADV